LLRDFADWFGDGVEKPASRKIGEKWGTPCSPDGGQMRKGAAIAAPFHLSLSYSMADLEGNCDMVENFILSAGSVG